VILTTFTQPIPSKDERAQLHKAVRELLTRQLETFTDESKASEEGGPRIVIKWAGAGDQRGKVPTPIQAAMADMDCQGKGGPLETVDTNLFCTLPFKKQIAKLRML
jgi:hypothetical protein